jgi:hypothetical protein
MTELVERMQEAQRASAIARARQDGVAMAVMVIREQDVSRVGKALAELESSLEAAAEEASLAFAEARERVMADIATRGEALKAGL